MHLRAARLHGHRLAYREAGEGAAIVLLHGLTASSVSWVPVGNRLAEGARVLAPDLLGHGASDKPRGDYSPAAHANLLRDLLKEVGCDRVTLVGHSFGGGVALQFAYQFPEQCERLVLVASGGLGREVGKVFRAATLPGLGAAVGLAWHPRAQHLRDVRDRVRGRVRNASQVQAGSAATGRGTPAGSVRDVQRPWTMDRAARQAFRSEVRGTVDLRGQRVTAGDRLAVLAEKPTLIIWGARDGVIPVRHGLAAAVALPHGRLVVLPRSGHEPHREEPVRVAHEVGRFLAIAATRSDTQRHAAAA